MKKSIYLEISLALLLSLCAELSEGKVYVDRDDTPKKDELYRLGIIIGIAGSGSGYSEVGTCLLEDDYGVVIGALEKDSRSVTDLVEQIFHIWRDGLGKKPTSWGVLVTCLRVAELNRLADNIESAYAKEVKERRLDDGHKITEEGNKHDQPPATYSSMDIRHASSQTWIIYYTIATVGAIIFATCFIRYYFTTPLGITNFHRFVKDKVSADTITNSDKLTQQSSSSKIIGVGSAKLGGPVQIAEQWKLLPLHEKGLNGQGVTIIILDSFVDSNFGPIFMKGQTQNIPSEDFIMVTKDMNEDKAHGTYCATIAAGAPCGDFRGGVAPAASLVCCRVSPDGKDFYEQGIVKALDYMLYHNVGVGYVVSMSFGCEKLHDDITKRINELTGRKVICVAAAGNDGPPEQMYFPACLGNVISVGSCKSTGQPSDFNNTGNIDVYAPGENLIPNELKGTSFAAPAIAGIIALLMQQAKKIDDPKIFANICDVNVIRKILTSDLKARGVDVLAPHELLEDGPEKLKRVIEKYTCT